MGAKKKFIIVVASLVVMLIAIITTIIVVLTTSNQKALSAVKLKYTASDVSVELSANAYIDEDVIPFTHNGLTGGNTSISLSPKTPVGVLSQPNTEQGLLLSKENKTIVFEYIFENLSDDINCDIALSSYPGKDGIGICENINLTYYYSSTKVATPSVLTGVGTYTNQLLNAYQGENGVKYVYIIATIRSLLYDANLDGEFSWALTRAVDSNITTYQVNVAGADYIERQSTDYSHMATASNPITNVEHSVYGGETVTIDDIDIFPAKAGYAFVGWKDASNNVLSFGYNEHSTLVTSKVASTALTTSSITPIYKEGTIDSKYYTWDSASNSYHLLNTTATTVTDFVIPDVYNDGTHGVAKVTVIQDGTASQSFLNKNTTANTITLGRYLTHIGNFAFYESNYIQTINYNSKNLTTNGYRSSAFYKNKEKSDQGIVKNITLNIGKGVEIIPQYMFGQQSHNNAPMITAINFENNSSLRRIGTSAFEFVSTFTELALPEGLKYMERAAFRGCVSLLAVVIPDSVTSMGVEVFGYCNHIKSISIGKGMTTIPDQTFNYCNTYISTVTIPDNITSIGYKAFDNCTKLVTVNIPNTVTTIGDSAFIGCVALKNVNMQSGLQSIAYGAFKNCTALESVTIPNTVTKLAQHVFAYCNNLTTLTFASATGWSKASNSAMTSNVSQVNLFDASQNAIWFKNTAGYYDYFWQKN